MEEYRQFLKGLLKESKTGRIGLFSGDMGVCFSLYLMNRSFKDEEVENIADELLDKVIVTITQMNDLSFDTGLSGIGWAINCLHANGCIEGDIDDILYNIDAAIYKSLYEQDRILSGDLVKGLIGFLVYFLYRLKNAENNTDGIQCSILEAGFRMVVDKLESCTTSRFASIQNDLYPTIISDFPILFFCLGEAMRMGIYREKIESLMNTWCYQLTGALPFLSVNRLALANSLAYVNKELNNQRLDAYVDTLFYSINFNDFSHDIEKSNLFLNGDWFCALFNIAQALHLMDRSHIRYMDLELTATRLYKDYCKTMSELLEELAIKSQSSALINGKGGALFAFCILRSLYNPSEDSRIKL
jgi:hypothetical protein